ncbi:MAG: hypothetical protein ABJA35_13980 [Parafilimonas sp.]
MRTEFISLFAELNAAELKSLTNEVKETIATTVHPEQVKPVFTTANLWNIHNMKRSRTIRKSAFS